MLTAVETIAAPHGQDDLSEAPLRFASALLFALWIVFWICLYVLGLREYRWEGTGNLVQFSTKYATAAFICTCIGLSQLVRAQHADHLLGTPLRWFRFLWKWVLGEAACFAVGLHAIPRVIAGLFGLPFDDRNWLLNESFDCAKFLFFYFIAGGIQFGIHTYWAWSNERLRASESARLAQEAQLTQLTQQLQPHFLFNGMNLISSLIHTNPDLADTLLGRLATLLRAATGAGSRPEQPLDHELALLRAYADIMTERFADRVVLEWQIDAGTSSCLFPTFGLQPLLENCFRHVVERRTATTRIVVRALRFKGDMIRIEVEDDGEHRTQVPVFGVGLGNLSRRLKALHGSRARVALIPRPEHGLVVLVEIPCAC